MRIGFDGKRAVRNNTGLGNYSRYVLEILCKYYPENTYIAFAPKKNSHLRMKHLQESYPHLHIRYPDTSFWKFFSKIWRIWGITRQCQKENIDIFHGLSNELPLNIQSSGIKSVVSIHDLIFLRYPHFYAYADRKIYEYKFKKACIHADHIIAVSECTKKDIINYFKVSSNKITTIYQGCDPSFSVVMEEHRKAAIRCKYHLPEHYILNVGSIEERKNVLLAVKAIAGIDEEMHLVIIGRRTKYTKKVKQYIRLHQLDNRVMILDNVPFTDLPAIYQQAEVFVYPSLYEGFGIPIVEALNSGVPVIAATNSCLEEAGGPSSLYVEPHDIKGLEAAIEHVLHDADFRAEMIRNGKEYAKKFSEERQADELMHLYQTLLHKK